MGGSNGGLLVGVMLTQRPDLFEAVVCQVPLLDMRRFNRLLAGASWMDEYGDPDKPEEWGFISKYSPYQNVEGQKVSARALHHFHARRPCASRPCAKNGGENEEQGHACSTTKTSKAAMAAAATCAGRAAFYV